MRRGRGWKTEVSVDTLFDDYVHAAEKIGVRRKAEKIALGMKLRKLVPQLARARCTVAVDIGDGTSEYRQLWCFVFPELKECCAAFEAAVGQSIDWGAPGDEETGRIRPILREATRRLPSNCPNCPNFIR